VLGSGSGAGALVVVVVCRAGNGRPEVDQPVTQPDPGRRVVAGPAAGNGRAGFCGAALAHEALSAKSVALVAEGSQMLIDLVLVQKVFHRSVSPSFIRH
jgi:hypothetical protein